MGIGNLVGVALLAVLGSLLVRRTAARIPKRMVPLVPIVLAILIVWGFGGLTEVQAVLMYGAVGGLLAGGILYILIGLFAEE